MSVKDDTRDWEEPWAYYSFATPAAERASAQGPQECYQCHNEHAGNDHVFVQFYPVLR